MVGASSGDVSDSGSGSGSGACLGLGLGLQLDLGQMTGLWGRLDLLPGLQGSV